MNPDQSWAPMKEFVAGKRGRKFPWEAGLALIVVISLMAWFLVPRYREARRTSQERVILDHVFKCLAAADRFFAENPGRLFMRYDEMVGPARPWAAALAPVAGEDYPALFPIRRDHPELAVKTRDGRRLIWFMYEGQNGRAEPGGVSQRANGTMVGEAEVLKAYRQFLEGEQPDGLHLKSFPDGSRFETTFRGGVPHGPFKAYYPDGKPWGEATYENGRAIGPCWNYPREGPRFDEMSPVDLTRALKSVP